MKTLARLKFYRRSPALWKEITLVLVLKIAAIMIIWKACFSDPVEKHLTVARMQQQLVGQIK